MASIVSPIKGHNYTSPSPNPERTCATCCHHSSDHRDDSVCFRIEQWPIVVPPGAYCDLWLDQQMNEIQAITKE